MTSTDRPPAISWQRSHVAAGLGGRPLLAARAPWQDARRGGLADAARAGEQEGVVDAVLRDGVGQRPRDVLLPDQLREALRPVLPREDQVRHRLGIYSGPEPLRACRGVFGAYRSAERRCDSTSSPSRPKRRCRPAHELAEQRGHQELTPEHLLAALLDQEQGVDAARSCASSGIDPAMRPRSRRRAPSTSSPQVRGSSADIYVGQPAQGPARGRDAAVQGVQGRVRLERAPAAGARGARTTAPRRAR